MSQSVGILDITLKASGDFSSKRYYVMKIATGTANAVELAVVRTDTSFGILQNEPKMSENAVVRVVGTSKVRASDTITMGDGVTATASGEVISVGTTLDFVIGIAMESAVENDIFEILLVHYRHTTS